MKAVVKGWCLLGRGILVVFSGRPAHAAEGPLPLVVEGFGFAISELTPPGRRGMSVG
jgi:hypothetical protein